MTRSPILLLAALALLALGCNDYDLAGDDLIWT